MRHRPDFFICVHIGSPRGSAGNCGSLTSIGMRSLCIGRFVFARCRGSHRCVVIGKHPGDQRVPGSISPLTAQRSHHVPLLSAFQLEVQVGVWRSCFSCDGARRVIDLRCGEGHSVPVRNRVSSDQDALHTCGGRGWLLAWLISVVQHGGAKLNLSAGETDELAVVSNATETPLRLYTYVCHNVRARKWLHTVVESSTMEGHRPSNTSKRGLMSERRQRRTPLQATFAPNCVVERSTLLCSSDLIGRRPIDVPRPRG